MQKEKCHHTYTDKIDTESIYKSRMLHHLVLQTLCECICFQDIGCPIHISYKTK